MRDISTVVLKSALCGLILMALQACTPASAPSSEINVAQAFESSNVMRVKPYTRTIFSTTDF